MNERVNVSDYLAGIEDSRRRELVWGLVRDAPSPKFGHQSVVTRTTVLLDAHVREHKLGVVCVSPIDVVLDEAKGLILQPDVIFVSHERQSIIREQIWGAPDLVVEVTSRRTALRDRTTKLRWYGRYGVRECWLLEPAARTVAIANLTVEPGDVRSFTNDEPISSRVLPALAIDAQAFFS